MKYKKSFMLVICALLIFILSLVPISALSVVINSKDWHDVYVGFQYARFHNANKVLFFSGPRSYDIIAAQIPKDDEVVILEAPKNFYNNYENYLKLNGFTNTKTIRVKSYMNILSSIAKDYNVRDFIIVSDLYGYDAISVAPYAYITNSLVLFVNKENLEKVIDILTTSNPNSVLVYGHLDRNIISRLNQFDPDVIDNKNLFKDNLEIAERFIKLKPSNTVLATTGEFIEAEIMSGGNGKYPVLFPGMNKVRDDFLDFLKRHNIKIVTLVGNELIPVGTKIRELTNRKVAVFTKFGQGFVGGPRKTGQIYALTVFNLPKYVISLTISKVIYNPKNKQLIVDYFNSGDMPVYFLSNIHILSNGEEVTIVNDPYPKFVEPGQTFNVVYDVDLSKYLSTNLTADFYTLYGIASDALDRYVLEGSANPPINRPIQISEFSNNAEVTIDNVYYNPKTKRFVIIVRNLGDVNAYVDAQIQDILINGVKKTLFLDNVAFVPSGATKELKIKAELDEADIADNPNIKVVLFYGQDKDLLTKQASQEFELVVRSATLFGGMFSALKSGGGVIALVIVVIVIAILIIKKRKKYKI